MITRQEIINIFADLSEGKLNAEEWIEWFKIYTEDIEKICGRRTFLSIKPKDSFSGVRNLYIGQLGAYDWLISQKADAQWSDRYKKGWEKEFSDFCKQEKQKEEHLRKTVENKFGHLKTIYPKFLKQLTKCYSDSDCIKNGVKTEAIHNKEKELSLQFPEELSVFYQNISTLKFEGLEINFEELSYEMIEDQPYLLIGEFWLYGDGDQLFYNPENQNVYIFAHENIPKMIKISSSWYDFVEKKTVNYLKEYE
ncbi:hypothetical protein [Chryseobacterium sp.]|uniref:hypothetical protein n=1 Tax=Chryseobacterium sp. TaxID=1871047 RepID=UPI001B14157D|nr:hypothetical protein [Chryseobacterium sp.]MBO9692171.1 hypothetical protein [Chryseobacterium sp.]